MSQQKLKIAIILKMVTGYRNIENKLTPKKSSRFILYYKLGNVFGNSRITSFNVVFCRIEQNKRSEVLVNNLFLFRRFDDHGHHYQEK